MERDCVMWMKKKYMRGKREPREEGEEERRQHRNETTYTWKKKANSPEVVRATGSQLLTNQEPDSSHIKCKGNCLCECVCVGDGHSHIK